MLLLLLIFLTWYWDPILSNPIGPNYVSFFSLCPLHLTPNYWKSKKQIIEEKNNKPPSNFNDFLETQEMFFHDSLCSDQLLSSFLRCHQWLLLVVLLRKKALIHQSIKKAKEHIVPAWMSSIFCHEKKKQRKKDQWLNHKNVREAEEGTAMEWSNAYNTKKKKE
jgi:hypothetical protein